MERFDPLHKVREDQQFMKVCTFLRVDPLVVARYIGRRILDFFLEAGDSG